MGNVLYVANLPFDVSVPELRARFAAYGEVAEIEIVADRSPSRSRSFAVVTMKLQASAAQAIRELNGSFLGGRALVVSVMEGRVLSPRPARAVLPPNETSMTRPSPSPGPSAGAAAATRRPGTPTQERSTVYEDGDPERRKKRRGEPAEDKPGVRMLQQFRQRTNMTYELECSGTTLVVRIFFPDESPAAQWRVEARTSSDSDVASATGASRALALESVASAWHAADGTRTPTKGDWEKVTQVMATLRAI